MPITVFFCYARKDKELLNELKNHLSSLQRQGLIDVWDDGEISAGTEWEVEVEITPSGYGEHKIDFYIKTSASFA
jgi:hypothetical protein